MYLGFLALAVFVQQDTTAEVLLSELQVGTKLT